MYARSLAGLVLTFDFASGLLGGNLLIVDRETGSVWSQLAGKAVAGDMRHTPLEAVPALQTTWGYWRERHPDTRVVRYPRITGLPYFYHDPDRPTPARRQQHDTRRLGMGLVVGNEAWFFPLRELERVEGSFPLVHTIAGERVVIHYAAAGLTAWAEDGEGRQLVTVMAYESGWRRFFPDTKVWRG